MKNYFIIFIYILSLKAYSQSKDTIYLLINKKDTLIKEIVHKKGSSNHYQIFSTEKIKTLKNNTPIVDGKVWVADTKYDYYIYEKESYEFNLLGKDKLISKEDLKSLNYIDNREDFLKKSRLIFKSALFFIESTKCGKYIMRKVYAVTYE